MRRRRDQETKNPKSQHSLAFFTPESQKKKTKYQSDVVALKTDDKLLQDFAASQKQLSALGKSFATLSKTVASKLHSLEVVTSSHSPGSVGFDLVRSLKLTPEKIEILQRDAQKIKEAHMACQSQIKELQNKFTLFRSRAITEGIDQVVKLPADLIKIIASYDEDKEEAQNMQVIKM